MSYQNITEFLTAFLSNENQIRKQSETFLDQLVAQNPMNALEFLMSGLELAQSEVRFFECKPYVLFYY